MDTAPSAPDLAAAPPSGIIEDVTAEQCAMLDELAELATTVARTLVRQIQATERAEPADVTSLSEMLRSARRTIALRNKLFAESRMTDEEVAAARARRNAERDAALARREAAAARTLLRERKEEVRATLEDLIKADAAERGTSADGTERLVQEMQERLLDADIERAFGFEDSSAIILGICKAMAITPRKEIWSHRLMQVQISATAAAVRDFQEGLKDPGGRTALPPTPAGLGNGPGPGGSYPKIGRFNFDATGAIVSVDPPAEPLSDWDVPKRRRPLDSG